MDLFDQKLSQKLAFEAPLADKMRPTTLEHFIGQNEVIGEGKLLRQLIEKDDIPSIIFWGPPGTGKTTLARIIANLTNSTFISFSAVSSGVKDLKAIVSRAQEKRKFDNQRTILFIDEIHRWNKSQQDALLPHVENGIITLIGATTENPSFQINSALLSRARVFVLEGLSEDDLFGVLNRALTSKDQGLGNYQVEASDDTIRYLAGLASGDARTALNALEFAVKATEPNKSGIIQLNQEIIKAVREELKLNIGEPTSEDIKVGVGSAVPLGERLDITVRGRDMLSGLPREVTIKDTQVRYWLARSLKTLIEAVKDLIEVAPPELVGDIYKNGIYLCGGGSLLRGIHQLFEKEIGVTVWTVEEPLTSIARGTGLIAEHFEEHKHLLNNFSNFRTGK